MPTVTTNIGGLNVASSLKQHSAQAANHSRSLASGSRIVSAATDSAAASISQRLTSIINVSEQAARNASQGASLIQTAVGGVQEVYTVAGSYEDPCNNCSI